MPRKYKCKHCGRYSDNGIKTPVARFCNYGCATKYAQIAQNKAREREKVKLDRLHREKEKAVRVDLRRRKQELKPKSKIREEAQAAVNKYIRLRDYYEPCISCGKSKQQVEREQGGKVGGCWDAGHFMGRGAKGQLRFIVFNIHKQCKSCNGGSGKYSSKEATVSKKYRVNLINKIGIEKVEWLENNNDIDVRKNDVEYLNRIKSIFNKKAKMMEKRINQ